MVKISLITFTRNNSKLLEGLLKNVYEIVDEIIVVDGNSEDNTIEVAEKFGAKVFKRKPKGFVEPERMFAISKCSNEWILYLDPDERLNKNLKQDLKNIVEVYGKIYDAIMVRRVNSTKNGVLLGSFWKDFQIRIYKKSKVCYKGKIHELPMMDGKIYRLPDQYAIIHLCLTIWDKNGQVCFHSS